MKNIVGLVVIATLSLAGFTASSAVATPEPVPVVQTPAAHMLDELRPLLKTLKAEDSDLVREGYEACYALQSQDKDSYREEVLQRYEPDLTLGLDHLTVAAAAKLYLCP